MALGVTNNPRLIVPSWPRNQDPDQPSRPAAPQSGATRTADASIGDTCAAMDWLGHRRDTIEAELARRHLASAVNPLRMALFDLPSLWLEGAHCPLAARGYSCGDKKGTTAAS